MRKQLFKGTMKRTLGLLLALVMVIGLLPLTAQAAPETPATEEALGGGGGPRPPANR